MTLTNEPTIRLETIKIMSAALSAALVVAALFGFIYGDSMTSAMQVVLAAPLALIATATPAGVRKYFIQ